MDGTFVLGGDQADLVAVMKVFWTLLALTLILICCAVELTCRQQPLRSQRLHDARPLLGGKGAGETEGLFDRGHEGTLDITQDARFDALVR